nr:MAG TPA: hypothetical protein [Inoviridae sp.]
MGFAVIPPPDRRKRLDKRPEECYLECRGNLE